MIKQSEEPTRETAPDPMLAGYRLDASPRRREGGSLLFSATTQDGSPAALQVSAEAVTSRRARSRFRRLTRTRAELAHPALLGLLLLFGRRLALGLSLGLTLGGPLGPPLGA